MNRRSFLASSIKAGVGLGFGARFSGRGSVFSGRQLSDISRRNQTVVTVEPRPPANYTSYVSRPDLTPVGVTVTAASAFTNSSLQSSYIFCAPKSPLAANPGRVPVDNHSFPTGATPGLMILDTAGELVWFKPLPGAHDIPFNFRVQTYKNKPTLTWFEGARQGSHGVGHYVLADNTYQSVTHVESTEYPADLHEFILTPDGTALHTAYEEGVIGDNGVRLIVGHAQEVDVATNELLFDWPCYPAVNPHLSYKPPFGDYFHINSIDLWPGASRNLLISARNTCSVYLVDRHTKQIIWRLGGKASDFAMDPGTRFYFQHDARALADGSGLSLFDDASQPSPEKVASGKVLAVNSQTKTASLIHRYLHTDEEFTTPSQGNCQLLGNSGHMVGWGYLPFFSAYAPSDETVEAPLIFDGRFPLGAASYRTFLFDWIGRPPQIELRLVVRPMGGSGQFTAWVSWNGATEVATWQIHAGASANSLETVATAKRQGFETMIEFLRDGAKNFEVVALDAKGQVIGRSDPVFAS